MAVETLTDQNLEALKTDDKPVIIKFFADWCGSCKLFAPKFKRLSNDANYEGIRFVEINAEQNPESRKFAGVTNLPFMASVKNGQIVEAVATSKEEQVVAMLNALKS